MTNATRWDRVKGAVSLNSLDPNPCGWVAVDDIHAVSYQTQVLGLTFFRYVRSRRNRSNSELSVALARRSF
jgi:hypothetical protein